MTWFHNYGFCHILRSNDGGSFRTSFTEEMHRLGVKHLKASAYNSSSNGRAERVVRSIKEYLRKENIQKVTQETTGRKKQWIETGVKKKPKISDDGTSHSFIINVDRGGQCLRNKCHMKHFKATTTPHRDDEARSDPSYINTRGRRRNN